MNAIVVYESLWGSTATVARAIAQGLGTGAQVVSTAEATLELIGGAELIVAGAPVHSLSLPTDQSREWATHGLGPGGAPPDLSHPKMRSWLAELPEGRGRCAAFDTRVQAWYGRGAAERILRALKRAGYEPIAKPRGFFVSGHPIQPKTDGTLRDGEAERARLWGVELARAIE
jgi:hypothetical protein